MLSKRTKMVAELDDMQLKALVKVQERKSYSKIMEELDISQGKLYNILRGLSGKDRKKTPVKWQTDLQYLRSFESRKAHQIGYHLTPTGLIAIDSEDIQVDIQESSSEEIEECEICGYDDPDVLEEHHIIPKSQGGGDEPRNKIEICCNCHAKVHTIISKGNHPVKALNLLAGQKIRDRKEVMGR